MKFFGNVGFAFQEETAPDVWREIVTKRPYRGDVIRRRQRMDNSNYRYGQSYNDELKLENEFSIVADDYMHKNAPYIRFIEFQGNAWKVTSIEIQYPRIILSLGGVYNGNTTPVS